ncbi:MAG: hypothetical protein ACYS17_03425 [Planctomycetota bacterium]
MDNKKSGISENIFQICSSLHVFWPKKAVVAGRKLICYINNLTIVDTLFETPADNEQKSKARNSKIYAVAD